MGESASLQWLAFDKSGAERTHASDALGPPIAGLLHSRAKGERRVGDYLAGYEWPPSLPCRQPSPELNRSIFVILRTGGKRHKRDYFLACFRRDTQKAFIRSECAFLWAPVSGFRFRARRPAAPDPLSWSPDGSAFCRRRPRCLPPAKSFDRAVKSVSLRNQ